MLSLVSVISANLIVLASPGADSGRAVPARVGESSPRASVNVPTSANGIVATAARYLGTRYRMGGTKPGAFDCSGFVRYVFARHGVALPRTANEQSGVGHPIAVGPDSLRVGDLLFFRTKRGRASHVAIYTGNGRIIHASSGSRHIRYDDLGSARGRWFIEHLSSVRRVLDPSATGIHAAEMDAGNSELGLLRSLTRAGD